MLRPANLLIYYGWLNAYESGECGWDNEKVAQSMAKYDLLVFGDGVQNPTHGDFSNTEVIIPRIKALNPHALIFGYVTIKQTLSDFQTKTDQWENLNVDGIFLDEAGYDYGKKRAEFNERVDYVHSREHANVCFANSWNIDHVLGTAEDASYPNATYNPGLLASNLNTEDWYLLESFTVNTDSYTGGYASRSDVVARGEKASLRRSEYEIHLGAVGIVANGDSNAQDLADFSYFAALGYCLDGNGISDACYGASTAKSKFFSRPEHREIEVVEEIPEMVSVGNDVLMKHIDQSKITLDFTSGSEDSSIEQY